MPLAGWLSDVIGRRAIYLAGTSFGILLAFPIFWLFETRDPTIVTWAIVVGLCLCQGVIFALHASFMPSCSAPTHATAASRWASNPARRLVAVSPR